jgi:hypothetical protein
MDQASQVDSPSDFGENPAAVASRWISELELAEKDQKRFVTKGRAIIKRYTDTRVDSNDVKKRNFSLLWANIETLAPAVYARTPTAVVSRRWKDGDPVGRVASEVIERALNFQIDVQDFADTMVALRNEFLLVGRGQAWVRYVPHMQTVQPAVGNDGGPPPGEDDDEPISADPDGEVTDTTDEYEEVVWEEVLVDHVHWEDFFTNPARTWKEVRWACRRSFLTRDELKARFKAKGANGDKTIGEDCPLDWKANAETDEKDRDTQFAKAAVYEIWDKTSRKAIWICKAYAEGPLDERDDPLELTDFFPCPRPLLATTGPDSIIPTADYNYYESQAQEISELTKRIGLLTDALKVRGFYAGTENQQLTDLLAAETNTLVPIDSWAGLMEKGGLDKLVSWFPVEVVAATLKDCIETRQQMLQDVFQITGIADIMRGDVDPNETATATKAKTNWGSSRVRDKQKELSRFARDLLRIMGEVISTKFDTKTLAKMTGVQLLPDPQTKQMVQQQIAMLSAPRPPMAPPAQPGPLGAPQPMQPGQPPTMQPGQPPAMQPGQPQPAPPPAPPPQIPAQLQQMLGDPTWSEVEAVLHDNATRTFRIEIETDSTIEPDDDQEKASRIEFLEAVGSYVQKSLPTLQLAPELLPVVIEGLKFLVRGFRVGREMEDVIDQAADALEKRAQAAAAQPHQGNPAEMMKAQADQTRAQADTIKAHADMTDAQTSQFRAQADAHLGAQQIQAEDQRTAADRQSDEGMHAQDIRADLQQAALKAIERQYTRGIAAPHLIPPTEQR